jgi:hypothetical protein
MSSADTWKNQRNEEKTKGVPHSDALVLFGATSGIIWLDEGVSLCMLFKNIYVQTNTQILP